MLGFKKLIMHFFHSLYISFGTDKEYLFSSLAGNHFLQYHGLDE